MNAGEASVATEARGVARTAKDALALIERMRMLIAEYKQRIQTDHPKVYLQHSPNNLLGRRYTRIEYVEQDLPTATKYLDTRAADFLDKQRIERNNSHMNQRLVALFVDGAA